MITLESAANRRADPAHGVLPRGKYAGDMMLPSLDQIHDAQNLIYRYMPPTPQYTWPLINQRLGTEVWIKHENHTPVGAFKIRSALVYAHWLKQTQPALDGIVAATRGNFGQGVGMAARLLGMKAVIVVPHGNSVEKNQAMLAQGVELIEHGHDFQESLEFARTLAAERGFVMFESFHETLMLGTATYALEFLQAVPDLDVVYVPIGMGSSICGMAAARKALNLSFEIVGVTAAACRATALSFKERQIVESPARTQIADGLACRKPSPGAMKIIWNHAARIVEVPDAEIAQAMVIYYQDTHNLAEGAGAIALAAALHEKDPNYGKKVGVILTGGNIDRDLFLTVLSGEACAATPA
ncbi:MAG: threonine dehydratase [Terracidiphilus sp.]